MAALERIGESEAAPGYLLLKLLSAQGWRISVLARQDGEEGVTVTATRLGCRTVEISGGSVAAVAVDVVKAATAQMRER